MADKKSSPLDGIFEEGKENTETIGTNEQETLEIPIKPVKPRVIKEEDSNHNVVTLDKELIATQRALDTVYLDLSSRIESLEMALKGVKVLSYLGITLGLLAYIVARKSAKTSSKGGGNDENNSKETVSD